MAVTKSTDLTNSVVTNYRREYMLVAAQRKEVYGQFVDWQDPIPDDGGFGGTLDYPMYGELEPIETELTEDADVTPTSIVDANMTLSPKEHGRAVGNTQLAAFKSRTKLQQIIAKQVALDRINSIDRIIRRTVCGFGNNLPTMCYYAHGGTTMAGMTATTGAPTWDWLNELVARAKSTGMEPFEDGNYMAIAHPLLMLEIRKFNEFRVTGMFQRPEMLFGYKAGEMAGINFVENHQARIHMAAGTAVQTATTLNGAVSAGATSVIVTSATGLAVGDYITIGTVETESLTAAQMIATKPETVLITAVNSTTLTVRGVGNKPGNFGLRFDHASAEAVTEAPTVASIPILGKNSILGAFASRTGRYGEPGIKTGLDIMDRIAYFRWYWYGGLARVDNYCVLGRCAVSKAVVGYN